MENGELIIFLFFAFCFLLYIAKAFEKAEEKLKTGFDGKMVKELDEETFIKYRVEGGNRSIMPEKKRNRILEQFRRGELDKLDLKYFGPNFKLNEIEINGINVKVGGKYDSEGNLDFTLETLYPSKEYILGK